MAISLASQTKLTAKRTGKRFRSIPPLENGDRLNRDEFEQRYEAMPSLKKAEWQRYSPCYSRAVRPMNTPSLSRI